MNLFYAPELKNTDNLYQFDKNESRHISKVLRKKNKDILHITNGLGDLFKVEIIDNNLNKTKVKIIEITHHPKASKHIHLAIAPTKSNDRFEWFLEKAVEIGVSEITPILTKHSERKKINEERYKRILIAAMKQSLQFYLPKINPLTKWEDFIKSSHEECKYVAYCKAEKHLKDLLMPGESYLLAIGPEGGFSPNEIEEAIRNKFITAGLSKNRLRTETAGIVGLTTLKICMD